MTASGLQASTMRSRTCCIVSSSTGRSISMTNQDVIALKEERCDNRSRPLAVSAAPATISRRLREHHGAPPPQDPREDRGGDEDEAGNAAPGDAA
jgi:hypothetical protein